MGPISVWTIWGEHVRRHLWIFTGLALIVGGLPGRQAAAAAGAHAASEPAAVSEGADEPAKTLFREQRYLEAAVEFERLWAEQRTPKYLFNAAMAREMLGHELQAFVHLQIFIGLPELAETEIIRAKDRIAGLRERTVKLRVRVAPADLPAGTLELNARRAGDPTRPERPAEVHLDGATLAALAVSGAPGVYDLPLEVGCWELEFTGRGYGPGRTSIQAMRGPASQIVVWLERLVDTVEVTAEFTPAAALVAGIDVSLQGPAPATRKRVERSPVTWRLKPGAWTLEASAAGYEPVRRAFTAGTESLRLEVQLAKGPRKDRRLALGLGVAGGAMAVTGAIMLGVAWSNWGRWRDDFQHRSAQLASATSDDDLAKRNTAWITASDGLTRHWRIMNTGAGTMGAGLGLGIASLTALAPRRRNLWIAQIAVGTATTLGMSLAYQFGAGKPFVAAQSTFGRGQSGGELDPFRTRGVVFGLFLGVGAGLVVGGVAGLIHDRKLRPALAVTRVFPYSDQNGAGLLLRRQF